MSLKSALKRVKKLEAKMKAGREAKLSDEVLEECIGFLCRDYVYHGGYPDAYDYTTIPGYLVIASSDDYEPTLSIFKMGKIKAWIVELQNILASNDDMECLYDVYTETGLLPEGE